MAVNFNPSYNGRGSAVMFPELDSMERSQERAGNLVVRGEEMKLNKALADKDSFQKMLAIDPVTAISTKNATDQAVMLEGYNNKWAKRYVESKGQLSFADEIEMQKDKSFLQASQKKVLADQEQYLAAKQIIQRDTRGYYDKDNFNASEQQYFKDGVLPPNMLDVAPQSITNALRKLPATAEETVPETRDVTDEKGNVTGKRIVDVTYNRTIPQAQNAILELMQEEAYLKTVIRDFDSLPESEQLKWIGDYNSDGVVDPKDTQYAHQNTNVKDNPIAKWAMNNPVYLDEARGKKEGVSKAIPSTKKGTSFDWNINIGGGNNQNGNFDILTDQTFGKTVFKNFLNLGSVTNPAKTQTIQSYVDLTTGQELPFNNAASFKVVGYSPDKDMVIVNVTQDADGKDNSLYQGDNIGLRGDQYDDLLRKKPFGIDRTSLIGKVPQTTATPTKTPAQLAMEEAKAKAGGK